MYTAALFQKIIFTGALLTTTALYNAAAFADDATSPKNTPSVGKVANPSDTAALKPEQQATFRKITKDMYESMRGGKELNDEVRELSQSDAYDEKKVRTLIQKKHKETEDNLVKSSKEMNEFYKTLTPEQKKQLDMIREKTKERRQEETKGQMKDRMKGHAEKKSTDALGDK